MEALIIEDDFNVADAVSLCLLLHLENLNISIAADGAKGLSELRSRSFDVVILDINLPDISGFNVLEHIRSFSDVPVIILTVRESEVDQARGLEMGADDYIVKPFIPKDLVARVNDVLRSTGTPEIILKKPPLKHGNLLLDPKTCVVHIGTEIIRLTPNEFKLLYLLIENAGVPLNDNQILNEVWGTDHSGTDTLMMYIRRLRHKLNDNPPRMILSAVDQGYKFAGSV